MPADILKRNERGDALLELTEDAPGGIRAAIVNHNDFVRNALQTQLQVQVLDRCGDAALFVACRDHHRQQLERWPTFLFRGGFHSSAPFQPVGMLFGVLGDLAQGFAQTHGREPAEIELRGGIVHDDPGNVVGAWAEVAGGLTCSEASIAPVVQLAERHGVRRAASHRVNATATLSRQSASGPVRGQRDHADSARPVPVCPCRQSRCTSRDAAANVRLSRMRKYPGPASRTGPRPPGHRSG